MRSDLKNDSEILFEIDGTIRFERMSQSSPHHSRREERCGEQQDVEPPSLPAGGDLWKRQEKRLRGSLGRHDSTVAFAVLYPA